MFRVWLKDLYLPKGHVYTTSDVSSVALWAPPGKWKITASTQLSVLPRFARLFGPGQLLRVLKTMSFIDSHHPDETPHWYLGILGTSPSRQGGGLGSRVIQPVLEQCDRAGRPAYLESSNPANIPFYERKGFQVTREIRIPNGPTMLGMWREPG